MPETGVLGGGRVAEELAESLTAAGHEVVQADLVDPGLASCAVVIDAEPDRGLDSKRARLAPLVELLPDSAVLGVAVESTSVTALAAGLQAIDRLVGVHWVRRAGGDGAVELVRVERAASAALEAVAALFSELEIATIATADRPGFLLDSLHLPFLNQAVQALDDGLASAADLDAAVRLGLGHEVGALEAVEDWGLAAYRERAIALHAETGDRWHAPPPLLERVIKATPGQDPSLNHIDSKV